MQIVSMEAEDAEQAAELRQISANVFVSSKLAE
jgi:hypothetical protein